MTLKQVCGKCGRTFYCKGINPHSPDRDCPYKEMGGCKQCDDCPNAFFKCGVIYESPKPRLGKLIGGIPIQ